MIQRLLLGTIRVRLHLKYEHFATRLGVDPSNLRLIESGAMPLRDPEITALSRLLRNPPTAWKHAFPHGVALHYHRLQQRARWAVNWQVIKKGLPHVSRNSRRLVNADVPCLDCREDAVAYDHRDYLRPLDVQPICQRCNYLRGVAIRTFIDHSDYWQPFDWIRL